MNKVNLKATERISTPFGEEVIDNCFSVNGVKLTEFHDQCSGRPFYLYNSNSIAERIESLRRIFPDSVRLHYAVKANPMSDVVNYVAEHVDGLDVASVGEMELAIRSGMSTDRISFAGPGKSVAELNRAVDAGVTLNVESTRELDRISDICQSKGKVVNVAIRVNPDFELKSSGMKMSGGPKQFGIDAEQVPRVLETLRSRPVQFVGFHIFSGSQNLRAESIVDAQQKSVDLAIYLASHAPCALKKLNIGGGFGIPYFPGEGALDIEPIGQSLQELTSKVDSSLPGCSLIIELGRYIVGEAGIYVAEILDKKVSRGQIFLIANGGLHHHLALSGNFGQVIRKNYPVAAATNMSGLATEKVSIVGPLCTPLDILGSNIELPVLDVGDLIAIYQSGAYGFSASPTRFLGHPEPYELMV